MKYLALIFILISQLSYSQTLMDQKLYIDVNVGVVDESNELNFLQKNNYNISSIYNNQVSFIELVMGGTNMASFSDESIFKSASAITFKYFYPIYSNDVVRRKYSGNLFGLDFGGINFFPRNSVVDFSISGGINMGSKKVRINRDVKYKNYIFAPRAIAQLRVMVTKKIGFNLKAEGQYDLTKDRWKLKKGDDIIPNMQGFRYHPLMLSAGLSFSML